MLRKLAHIIVWIGVFAYLAMALAFTERMEKTQTVENIEVEIVDSSEIQFVDRDDVIAKLRSHGFRISGILIDSINRSAISEVVNDITGVKDGCVFYTPDSDLHIRIWQCRPLLRIKSGGQDYYLDEDSNVLQFSSKYSPRVIVMTGNIDLEMARNRLFGLAMFISEDLFFSSLIQEIHINSKQFLEIIPRIGKHRIFMGEADNYEWKLSKLKAFYEKAIPNLGWERYSSIDLRYGDQVVCKKIDSNSIN
jgi:cell division protein FtsQ